MIATPEAYRLFHEGGLALADVEANGIRIDLDHLHKSAKRLTKRRKKLAEEMMAGPEYKAWKKRYKEKANLYSLSQLGHVLFDELKFPYPEGAQFRTKSGKYRTDEEMLDSVDSDFAKKHAQLRRMQKMTSTYLKGILNETVDGYLHPCFWLNTVRTYRSSSSTINFQNIPIRDPEFGRMIRQCFIAREGRVLVEIDFGALEFRIAACFWADPKMIEYAADPDKDIHRDTAMRLFKLKKHEVGKRTTRDWAKNRFVFPVLYGSYYRKCAPHIWEAVCDESNKVEGSEVSIKQHLRSKGIKELGRCDSDYPPQPGTFEHHVKSVEDDFNQRFPGFGQGKKDWQRKYEETGSYQLMTGFVIKWGRGGLPSKNNLLNDPIQGPGFHCLLWTLIRLNKLIKKRRLESLIVGQIHDCVLLDCPVNELQEILDLAHRIISTDLAKAWDWIKVPLIAEVDVTTVGASWADKKPWKCVDGVWRPAA